MYTATLKLKEEVAQGLRITVDFSNGVKTITETVIPQDETGLKYWVKSRLASLNSIEVIDSTYTVDTEIDTDDVVVPPTQAELDKVEWFSDFARMERVQKLVDLGVIPSDHAKVTALRTKLQTNLKASYIDAL
jgi:hypothetical protein